MFIMSSKYNCFTIGIRKSVNMITILYFLRKQKRKSKYFYFQELQLRNKILKTLLHKTIFPPPLYNIVFNVFFLL